VTNPAEFSLRRPKLIALLALLCASYGWLSYLDLPRQENPTLRDRHAQIVVYLPGAEPDKVERLVTKVIEARVAEVDDIEEIFSRSAYGYSLTIVELQRSAPLAARLQELRAKAEEAAALLPPEASEPEIETEVLRTHTMILALTLDRPLAAGRRGPALVLRHWARRLERELQQLPNVRSVALQGLPEEEIEIELDIQRLTHRRLGMDSVVSALARRNIALPSGELELNGQRSSIQISGVFDAVAEVGTTLLSSGIDGKTVRLDDVSRVRRRLADPEVIVRHGGAPAVTLAIEMLDGRNAIQFGERVREWIDATEPQLPAGLRIAVVADEPTYVADRLNRLFGSLRIGMVLVAGISLLGMGWRSGTVVSLSIPLSMVVAFGFMGLAGVELQQLSIAALVIGIGLVVDEAIVVTDSIQRHIDLGRPPRQAAVKGLAEIHLAVLAGAATTVAAFIPLFLMRGDVGDFVSSIPLVVSLMILGSVLVAHFVTPLCCVFVHERLRPRSRDRTGVAHSLQDSTAALTNRGRRVYRALLEGALAHPVWVLVAFVGALGSAFVAIGVLLWPPQFFGVADRHQFLVEVRMPPSTPVERTAEVVADLGAWLQADERVESWTSYAGSEAPKFYYNEFPDGRSESIGMLVVNTVATLPFEETLAVVDALNRDRRGAVPGAWIRARALRQGYGGERDIRIFTQGDDLETLRSLTQEISAIAREQAGVIGVNDSFGYESLTLAARIDPNRAEALGISHRDVARALRMALDGVVVTHFPEDDVEIPIVVRLPPEQRRDAADLAALPIFSPAAGRTVPLAQVARIEPAFAHSAILRFDRQREGSIGVDVEGVPVKIVTDAIEARVAGEVTLPPGYSIHYYGQRKEATESFLSLARAALLAVFLIYTILVIRFQSLMQPALVVLAIPMALIGSVWGLVITGMPLSFTAFLGMIALTGIVVNDSIVLLDYINTLRARGHCLERAIIEGTQTRLRPVLMTSLTTIAGLIPLSVSGGEFWGPFGFSMIFGLAASTVLTLLIQPAVYGLLERRRSEQVEPRLKAVEA
jgi:multidrug efflux pump subunit AcrB